MRRQHIIVRRKNVVARVRWAFGILIALAILESPRVARAHEGHAALPSKGLTVQGNQLLLSEGARRAIDLKTAKVGLADMGRVVSCNARVELPWHQQALVTTQVPGRIEGVWVRPGETVREGQELARVESLELESLQLAMLQADAELVLARDAFDRRAALAEQGVIAEKDALEAQSVLQQKNAELEITLCKLRALGLEQSLLDQIRQTRNPQPIFAIVSPISGTLAEADVRVGQIVKTTEHLFHVADLSSIWVLGDVLEGDVSHVQLGQPATITLKSLPGRSFQGKIDNLFLKMDEKRRTRAVVVKLPNSEMLLRPGMFGRMTIEIVRSEQAIACPAEGIISGSDQEYVLLGRGDGKYIRQPVTVGIRQHDRVEILNGLFPGDQVVVNGNYLLFSLFGGDQSNEDNAPAVSTSKRNLRSQANVVVHEENASDGGTIIVQGTVELPTDRKVFTSSRIEGRIARILVDHGQAVKAGQTLAEVESLELGNLQGSLLETQAKLAWTRQRLRSLESLGEKNVTSRNELWRLQTDERVLANKSASAARRLVMIGLSEEEIDRLLETDLSANDCNLTVVRTVPIRAPLDGAIAGFDVVPGQIVNDQHVLFEIQDTSKVWVRGYVFQQDTIDIQPGQQAQVTFTAHPGLAVNGTVVRIAPTLDVPERVFPLWVELENPDGRFIEGMLARLEITRIRSPLASDPNAPAPRSRSLTE